MTADRCAECGAFITLDGVWLHWSTGREECGPQVPRNDSLRRRLSADVPLYCDGVLIPGSHTPLRG